MESKSEVNVGKFVGRHLSQLKILTRLLDHELDAAKGAREITLDRDLIENVIDTLEIFIEDVAGGDSSARAAKPAVAEKPAVTRLN